MQNRHPADRLADVRSEIKRLEAEEEQLRAYLLEHFLVALLPCCLVALLPYFSFFSYLGGIRVRTWCASASYGNQCSVTRIEWPLRASIVSARASGLLQQDQSPVLGHSSDPQFG
jgi:hypothetical protein